MDFNALRNAVAGNNEYAFPADVSIDGDVQKYTMVFTLRNPTSTESRDFMARSSRVDLKSGTAKVSEVAQYAPLWLLEKLLIKKECFNGTAERESIPDDIWEVMADEFKRNLIATHINKIRGEETEIVKNSQRSSTNS